MKKSLLISIMILLSVQSFAQSPIKNSYIDTLNKKKLYTTIGVGAGIYLTGISIFIHNRHKDDNRGHFHFTNDLEGYLQMDKVKHAYVAYITSSIVYNSLRSAGVSKRGAIIFGGPAGLILQTPIEIFDGLYEGCGFSWYDMAANALGSAFFTTQEVLFNEQVVLMKFSYYPSKYPQYGNDLGDSHFERFFLDYNANTYWLSANIKKITGSKKIPPWLNFAFGYSANGMINKYDNPEYYQGEPLHIKRYRQFLFSPDIDFSRIPSNKRWLKNVFKALNLFKVPFPALEINSADGVKFWWLHY